MLKTAKTAAISAGKLLKSYFGHLDSYSAKGGNPRDYVTKADLASEKLIKKIILDKFPNHNFWGEESGKTDKTSNFTWVVDPLDGTSNFVLNIPMYSVSIALMKNNEVVLGVVYIPQTDELFWAQKSKGAFCNGKKIHVSNTKKLSDAIGSIEYWSKDNTRIEKGLEEFNFYARKIKKIRYLSSTVFEMCRVAKGNLDFCIMDSTVLDIAAASFIIHEASGKCLVDGKRFNMVSLQSIFRIYCGNALMKIILKK
ncbi:MAG: inositol monophosphatase family protein [Candidatus Magasanikbacteria bacterium]|jgi:myo-inositol-1(or 4)-monophosphatase